MENKLSCEIVRDLLPSYVDGLTGDATNEAVETHLEGCEDCTAMLRRMKEPEPPKTAPDSEVDYLKTVRRRNRLKSLIIGISLMLIAVSILAFKVFYIGTKIDASELICNVSAVDGTVTVSGTVAGSSGLGISRVTFSDSSGMVQMNVYAAPKMFFNSGEFSATYAAKAPVMRVRADDLIIWENGVNISSMAARLYAEINPFVGDMPSNSRIAAVLGISDQFGPYTNELQTTTEPYGWSLILETPIEPGDESVVHGIMDADSYAMLATVENLGYVTWHYTVNSVEREYTVNAADATAFAGRDIKGFADSVSLFQSLLEKLSFKWSGVRGALQDDGVFSLRINNNCQEDIYSVGIHYYLDGKLIGTGSFEHADQSLLSFGDYATFSLTPGDFPDGTSATDLYNFSFDIYIVDESGHETAIREGIPVSAKYGWTYFYTITGDGENGFILNEG